MRRTCWLDQDSSFWVALFEVALLEAARKPLYFWPLAKQAEREFSPCRQRGLLNALLFSSMGGCSGQPDIRCPTWKKCPLEWRVLAWETIFYGSLSSQKPSPSSKRTITRQKDDLVLFGK